MKTLFKFLWPWSFVFCGLSFPVAAADYSAIVAKVKPSIVAIGNYQPLRNPQVQFVGTGFVVGDGRHVITNEHNIPAFLDLEKKESLVVIAHDNPTKVRMATTVAKDAVHDIAVLKFSDAPLPALKVDSTEEIKEGQEFLMTGFPIGGVLGYRPVTHKTMVSAITPAVQPVEKAHQITAKLLRRMKDQYDVYQLDAIAYPGNSGSPLYDMETGAVIGVLNSVFVKETKESVLENPSGISYAIPIEHAEKLMKEHGVNH